MNVKILLSHPFPTLSAAKNHQTLECNIFIHKYNADNTKLVGSPYRIINEARNCNLPYVVETKLDKRSHVVHTKKYRLYLLLCRSKILL